MTIGITAPHLGTLVTTGTSYFVMNGMLTCVEMPEQHIAREVVKYAALVFGALTIVKYDNNGVYHVRTNERDKIDLLCSKGYPKNLNPYQEKTLDKICNNYEHNSMHALEMLCAITGDYSFCSDIA